MNIVVHVKRIKGIRRKRGIIIIPLLLQLDWFFQIHTYAWKRGPVTGDRIQLSVRKGEEQTKPSQSETRTLALRLTRVSVQDGSRLGGAS